VIHTKKGTGWSEHTAEEWSENFVFFDWMLVFASK